MPTRNEIIADFYACKDFNDCIGKMHPEELRDDLKAEVVLILLEKNEEEIVRIYEKKELRFYAARIIMNLIQSNTSPFYKKYRGVTFEYNDGYYNDDSLALPCPPLSQLELADIVEDFTLRMTQEAREEKLNNIISNLYWYNREMLTLYTETGSYRGMQKVTGIHWHSCYDTIQETFNMIRYEFRRNTST